MWKIIKNSFLINLGLLILAVFLGWSAFNTVYDAYLIDKEARESQKVVQELLWKKAQLEASIAELQTRQAVEREAKERLNLKLPRENVVVVVSEKKDDGNNATSTEVSRAREWWVDKVKKVFNWE